MWFNLGLPDWPGHYRFHTLYRCLEEKSFNIKCYGFKFIVLKITNLIKCIKTILGI